MSSLNGVENQCLSVLVDIIALSSRPIGEHPGEENSVAMVSKKSARNKYFQPRTEEKYTKHLTKLETWNFESNRG